MQRMARMAFIQQSVYEQILLGLELLPFLYLFHTKQEQYVFIFQSAPLSEILYNGCQACQCCLSVG